MFEERCVCALSACRGGQKVAFQGTSHPTGLEGAIGSHPTTCGGRTVHGKLGVFWPSAGLYLLLAFLCSLLDDLMSRRVKP